MTLDHVLRTTTEVFDRHLEDLRSNLGIFADVPREEQEARIQEVEEAKRLLEGLLRAELRQRAQRTGPPEHSILIFNIPQGPQGETFTFVRRSDTLQENPLGSRGWYHNEAATQTAMWEDHDEMRASR